MYDNKPNSAVSKSLFPGNGKNFSTPLQVVEYYLNNGSLRKTAKEFNIHYNTLWKWVKTYKRIQDAGYRIQDGKLETNKERLLTGYRRPWNRTKKELEEKIALLKEKAPTLTVRKAKKILEKDGIKISIKGIWGVWKRFGYAGFKKENMTNDFTEYCPWSKEAEAKFKQVKRLFAPPRDSGVEMTKECAKILNSIPFLPKNETIRLIPDKFLNLKRQIEKLSHLFGKIPLPAYFKKIEDLYQECKRKNLNYSALRIGLTGVIALEWSGKPQEQLKRIKELKKIIKRKGNYCSYLLFEPRFTLFISEGIAYSYLSEIKKAKEIASLCKNLLRKRKHISPYFMFDLASLYEKLENYPVAEHWFLKSLRDVNNETKGIMKAYLANILLYKGKFEHAKIFAKGARFSEWGEKLWNRLFNSLISIAKGEPHKAISFSTDLLYLSRKKEFYRALFDSSLTIASAYSSIGERKKAREILLRTLPYFVRNKLKRQEEIIRILTSHNFILKDENILPTVKLAMLLKNRKYFKALIYAKKKGILSYFYRYIFFFPELVVNLLEKGKKTGLPKAILKLPVFNPDFDIRGRFRDNKI